MNSNLAKLVTKKCSSLSKFAPIRAIITLYSKIDLVKCTECNGYHCPICHCYASIHNSAPQTYSREDIWDHMYTSHISQAIEVFGFFVSECFCSDNYNSPHWHCVVCMECVSSPAHLEDHCLAFHGKDISCVLSNSRLFTVLIDKLPFTAKVAKSIINPLTKNLQVEFFQDHYGSLFAQGTLHALKLTERVLEVALNTQNVKRNWNEFIQNLPYSYEACLALQSVLSFLDKDDTAMQLDSITNEISDPLSISLIRNILTTNKNVSLNLMSNMHPVSQQSSNLNIEQRNKQFWCIFCQSSHDKSSFVKHIAQCGPSKGKFASKLNGMLKEQHFCTCIGCWSFFGFSDAFTHHIFQCNENVSCSICGKKFKNCFEVLVHKETHHEAFVCSICNMICETQEQIESHAAFYHQSAANSATCVSFAKVVSLIECNKIFSLFFLQYKILCRSKNDFVAKPESENKENLPLQGKEEEEDDEEELLLGKTSKKSSKKKSNTRKNSSGESSKQSQKAKLAEKSTNAPKTPANSPNLAEYNYKCLLCKTPLKDEHQAVRLHYKMFHSQVCSKVSFKCSLCPYTTQYRNTFGNHKKLAHSRAIEGTVYLQIIFKCTLCQDEYIKGEDEFLQHLNEVHYSPDLFVKNMNPNYRKVGRKPKNYKPSPADAQSAERQQSSLSGSKDDNCFIIEDVFDKFF